MKLLLAIDESPCSDAAVRAVIDQFRPEGTAIRVLHVIGWPAELPPSSMFDEGPRAADHVGTAHDALRRRSSELVGAAVDRLARAGFAASAHVTEGDPCDEILAMSGAWHADVVVVGSHGRKGLDRVLLGSVSARVLREAGCSVLVVRTDPKGLRGNSLRPAS
jgi:nucleotide-binding universal stress UspA family protein